MRCLYCNGKMEKMDSAYTVNRKDYHLFIEKIPAYVCTKCGEKHFEEQEVDAIQKMIHHLETDLKKVQTMV